MSVLNGRWALGLILLFPAFQGCLSDADGTEARVQLPPPPRSLQGTYVFSTLGGGPSVEVVFETTPSACSAGDHGCTTPSLLLKMRVRGEGTTPASFTVEVPFLDGSRIAEARLRCSDGGSFSCGPSSPRAATIIQDMWGAPAFFGLGPFLGQALVPGKSLTFDLWDPTGSVEVRWTVEEAPAWEGRACAWLRSERPAVPKTFAPYAPFWGNLLACEGLPVPAGATWGPVTMTLVDVSYEGHLPPFGPPPEPVRLDVGEGCFTVLPPKGERVLNLTTYMRWASREDEAVRSWLEEHPDGAALPGYGQSFREPREGPLGSSAYVSAILALYDPASGVVHGRLAKQTTQEGLIAQGTTFRESSPIVDGQVRGSREPVPPCAGPFRPAQDVVAALLDRMQVEAASVDVLLAPEALASWQGSGRVFWPLRYLSGSGTFASEPWPPRLYVAVTPHSEDGVALILNGAVDPGTGWPRWYDLGRTS